MHRLHKQTMISFLTSLFTQTTTNRIEMHRLQKQNMYDFLCDIPFNIDHNKQNRNAQTTTNRIEMLRLHKQKRNKQTLQIEQKCIDCTYRIEIHRLHKQTMISCVTSLFTQTTTNRIEMHRLHKQKRNIQTTQIYYFSC